MKENKKQIIAGWKTNCAREKEARKRFAIGVLEELHSVKRQSEPLHKS